jgi:hypothetical protein
MADQTGTYRAVLENAMAAAAQIAEPFTAPDDDAAEAELRSILARNWQEPGAVVRLERAKDSGWEPTGVEVHVDE